MDSDDIDAMAALLPQGFADQSWHHDSCPKFVKPLPNGGHICVYIDAEKLEDREVSHSRFSVHILDDNYETSGHVLDTDDIGEVVAAVNRLLESKGPL